MNFLVEIGGDQVQNLRFKIQNYNSKSKIVLFPVGEEYQRKVKDILLIQGKEELFPKSLS
jgi:hypothetical protein